MRHSVFLLIIFASAVLLILELAQAQDTASKRPNILFIMADDHCRQAISSYGSKTIQTPHIDRIAREGMRFTHFTVTNSICSPSRAVLLTGKYSHLNRMRTNRDSFDGNQLTFPKQLQQAGYETAMVGKWHLRSQPTGFDYYVVLPFQGRYFDCRFKETGQLWQDGNKGGEEKAGYVTDVITDVAIQWLEKRADRLAPEPFCMMVYHKAPHAPHHPAPRHEQLFAETTFPEPPTLLDEYLGRTPEAIADKMGYTRLVINKESDYREQLTSLPQDRSSATRQIYQSYMKGYLRLLAALDENVGRLLDYLNETGLSDNTLVVYTSDNGYFNGEHGFYNKMWMYELSLRPPLLVWYPGAINSGSVSSELVSMLDLAPTFLDFAGADIPDEMQGVSLRSLFEGSNPRGREAIYYHYYAAFDVPEIVGVRTRTHKLIYYPEMSVPFRLELFDIEKDPEEIQNLYHLPEYELLSNKLKANLGSLVRKYEDTVAIE